MPGRKFAASDLYRYGFIGKENDNDVKGEGNQQDYGMRIYDPRLGRFLSVDPLTEDYPWFTPYQFAGNMPVWAVDIDGLEGDQKPNENEKKETESDAGKDDAMKEAAAFLDRNLAGGEAENNNKREFLSSALKIQIQDLALYRSSRDNVINELFETEDKLGVSAGVLLDLWKEYDVKIAEKQKAVTYLIQQLYAIDNHARNIDTYNQSLQAGLKTSGYYLNAAAVAASFIPSGGTSALGLYSIGGRLPIGMTVREATGGIKQWIRFGSSYSKTSQTTTWGIRWGAGSNFARTIGSYRLKLANITFRGNRVFPKLNLGWNEGGHLHLINTSILSKPQWGKLSLQNTLRLIK